MNLSLLQVFYMANRDIADILNKLRSKDVIIKRSKTNHYKLYNLNGVFKMTIASTPSDRRAIANIKSQLNRYFGIDISATQ